MSFISSGAIHHRNWNLLLDLNGDGGQTPSGGGGGSHTITYSFSNALAPVEISTSNNLPKFDPGLGTLTGASITLNTTLDSTLDLNCGISATFPKSIKGTTNCDVTLASSLGVLDALIAPQQPQSSTATTGFFLAQQSTNYNFPNLPGSTSMTLDLVSILASLIGVAQTFTITGDSLTGSGVTNGVGVTLFTDVKAATSGSITYTYTTP